MNYQLIAIALFVVTLIILAIIIYVDNRRRELIARNNPD